MKNYMQQLQELAKETGWDLKQAMLDCGVADSTYYRWARRTVEPCWKKAKQVADYMEMYRRS